MDPYKRLANAIIFQAADDYRNVPAKRKSIETRLARAKAKLEEVEATLVEDDIKKAQRKVESIENEGFALGRDIYRIEKFFRSELFVLLSDTDGEGILLALKKEIGM